jgi:netrin-G3 ligand
LAYEEQKQVISKKTARVAHSDANKHKNRYSNVVPYDDTRVVLSRVPGDDASDYINASVIDGEAAGSEAAYIATQGPLQHTIADFWRMVWETRATLIVMLGMEREKEKIKVDRYWPLHEGDEEYHQLVRVKLLECKRYEDNAIIRRVMEVQLMAADHEVRRVCHYQYGEWPDHGSPPTTKHVRELIQMLY